MMIFNGHLCELLKGSPIVTCVFHACLGKYRWHSAGTHQTFLGDTGLAASAAQQTFAHLLNANCQDDIVETSLH